MTKLSYLSLNLGDYEITKPSNLHLRMAVETKILN